MWTACTAVNNSTYYYGSGTLNAIGAANIVSVFIANPPRLSPVQFYSILCSVNNNNNIISTQDELICLTHSHNSCR